MQNKNISIQVKFGQVIRARRLHLNITQEELAFRANLHRTYIADVERGSRNLSLKNIEAIIGALEINLSEIFKSIEELHDHNSEA